MTRIPPPAPRKGRGAVTAIAHRFASVDREADGDALDALRLVAREEARTGRTVFAGNAAAGDPAEDPDAMSAPGCAAAADEPPLPPLRTEVTWEDPRSVLTYNVSPDIGFDRSINPYRGCEHGCIYCYARPTHSYLNLSPGLDFETKLVAKRNAAAVLRRELAAAGYRAAPVSIGAATDAYQPVERELKVTRGLLEVLCEARHPLILVTKSALIERDIDLLAPAAALDLVSVSVSVTTLDGGLARTLEPRAAAPARRLRVIRTLAQAGIPVQVNVAPVIPFVNEPELEQILAAAADAGARHAFYTIVRLPWEVAPLFRQWLDAHLPDRARRVMARIQDMRGGRDYDADFDQRMTGTGVWAELIRTRFDTACARLGLGGRHAELRSDRFVAPAAPAAAAPSRGGPPPAAGQLDLF